MSKRGGATRRPGPGPCSWPRPGGSWRKGGTPTVEDVAARSGISRPHHGVPVLPQPARPARSQPTRRSSHHLAARRRCPQRRSKARLDQVMRAFPTAITLDWEPQLRTSLRLSLEPGAPRPQPVLRQGRAIGWIAGALTPLLAHSHPAHRHPTPRHRHPLGDRHRGADLADRHRSPDARRGTTAHAGERSRHTSGGHGRRRVPTPGCQDLTHSASCRHRDTVSVSPASARATITVSVRGTTIRN